MTACSSADWRRLYEAALAVRTLAPWEWMSETMVFGVRTGPDAEPAFVSVMGETGQHFAVAAYRGVAALYGFIAMESGDEEDEDGAERLLEIPQLQVSFEDRRMLDRRDHQLIRALGLPVRGRRAWPMFRRYRPGHLPWFLEVADVELLSTVLEQTLHVAPRVRADDSLVWPPGQGHFLVRTLSDGARWGERVERVTPPAAPTFSVDRAVLERLGRLPRRPVALEADIFRLPGAVQDGDGPPFLVYAVMLVDAASGVIVGAQLLEPRPALDRMLDRIPTTVASMLLAAGMVPAEVRVRSDRAIAMLQPLAAAGFALRQAQKLPALDTARIAMAASLAR